MVLFGNFRIAIRAKTPEVCGIFHQKRASVSLNRGKTVRYIRAEFVPYGRIEAIVDMREHNVEMRFCRLDRSISLSQSDCIREASTARNSRNLRRADGFFVAE